MYMIVHVHVCMCMSVDMEKYPHVYIYIYDDDEHVKSTNLQPIYSRFAAWRACHLLLKVSMKDEDLAHQARHQAAPQKTSDVSN